MNNYKSVIEILNIDATKLGNSKSDILNKETDLGIELPEALKKFYLVFGRNEKLRTSVNKFVLLNDLTLNKDGELLFYKDYQTGLKCFMKEKDLIKNKFKFYWRASLDKKWEHETENIYTSIESILLYTALLSLSNRAIKFGAKDSVIEDTYKNFSQLGDFRKEINTTFYQNNPNQLIGVNISEGSNLLLVASNNILDFKKILKVLKVDWLFLMENNDIKIKRFGGMG